MITERGPSRYILPNALTISRPFFAWKAADAIKNRQKGKALTLVSAGMATDMDGSVARSLDATSALGAFLDPLADTIFRFKIFKALEMAPGTKAIKAIAESAIFVTNVALYAMSILDDSISPPSVDMIGKIRFTLDGAAATRLIIKPKDVVASWAIAGMSVLTAIDYINSARKTINGK